MNYPVYVQNLDFMKQLVATMSNSKHSKNIHIPRVFGILNGTTGYFSKVNIRNAISKAALLKPGDKVSISLLNGDWVMQVRFPSLREESWTSMQVKKDHNSIITIPLPCCEMKAADFDGDEAQTYAMNSHVTDIESVLLHSVFRQMIGYKTGDFAIWYSADAPDGLSQINRSTVSSIYNYQLADPPVKLLEKAESYFPKDLCYKDESIEIKNGKFVGDKIQLMNSDLHKYITFMYGPMVTEKLMVNNINLGYDMNKNNGNTLGFEICINTKEAKEKIRKIINDNYNELKKIEQSNSEHKFLQEKIITEKQKSLIEEILINDSKDTNIGRLKYTTKRIDEFYQMVVLMDYINIDGGRIEPILAEESRTTCAHPRHSIDPVSRGYCHCSYNSDISPLAHFYDCKQSRQALFIKGQGTAKQGYMGKRLGVAYGDSYIDFCGQVVNNFKIISPQYGCIGLDPRRNVVQKLPDIKMDINEFSEKYKLDKKIIELRKKIEEYQDRYKSLTLFTKQNSINDTFISGFYFDQYIDQLAEENQY